MAASMPAQHLLYVAEPGTRNYVEHGGVGILVFDMKTGRIYVSSLNRMIAIDPVSGKKIWDKAYEGGCDRMAISPDGKTLYVPQL